MSAIFFLPGKGLLFAADISSPTPFFAATLHIVNHRVKSGGGGTSKDNATNHCKEWEILSTASYQGQKWSLQRTNAELSASADPSIIPEGLCTSLLLHANKLFVIILIYVLSTIEHKTLRKSFLCGTKVAVQLEREKNKRVVGIFPFP